MVKLMSQFKIRFPNQFDAQEKPLFDAWAAECEAINSRGPVDIDALVSGRLPADTPGIGNIVTGYEDMIMYNNRKYIPDNPLFNDLEYAKGAGFESIPAMMTFASHDDNFMIPAPQAARDIMLVSGLNHSITSHRPIYPGDTFCLVTDERHFTDLTPETGSEYRSIAIQSKGSIYNQKGELVNSVVFRVTESLKTFADGQRPEKFEAWEGPPWYNREDHYYTDEDWTLIRSIWDGEYMRGGDALYWEDVNIGDEPAWTLDGPIDDNLEPVAPWGQGIGGSRTLKREITDPATFGAMVRNPYDGIYRLEKRSMSYPQFPKYEMKSKYGVEQGFGATSFSDSDDPTSKPPDRFMFINYMGRDFAIRHFTNWMGDRGWLKNIRWGIMPPLCMQAYGYNLPENPEAVDFMEHLPEMRGKCLHHGMERDVFIIKSKVYDKRIEDGEHLVDLVWWIETITGDVFEEGGATIRLPSRG